MNEARQSNFFQWVDRDNACAALLGSFKRRQHARMIGAGILAEDDDHVGAFEVVQGHGGLARTESFDQCEAG